MTAKRIRDFVQLQSGRTDWYSIKNQADGSAEVSIYDDIGWFGVTAQNFAKDIGKIRGPITLRLNSAGGEVFDGLAIYNTLKGRENVSVIIDGVAASIASVIAQAASPGQLSIARRGQIMIHDGFTDAVGNADDFRKLAAMLDEQSDNIAGVYADRTGKPVSYWRDKMRNETWYFGEQAVAEGLADRIHEPVQNRLHNKNAGWQQRDGKWVFDPDNDGDDDGSPSGDSDNDYWDKNGNQLKSIPPNPDGKGGKPLLPGQKGKKGSKGNQSGRTYWNEKYKQADRDRMAASGHAMPDGSYPIEDAEDVGNAVQAVGMGNADHDAIRRHVMKRAHALGEDAQIPDSWNKDGSLKSQLASGRLLASALSRALEGGN